MGMVIGMGMGMVIGRWKLAIYILNINGNHSTAILSALLCSYQVEMIMYGQKRAFLYLSGNSLCSAVATTLIRIIPK